MNILYLAATSIECDDTTHIGDSFIQNIGVGKLSSSFHTQRLIRKYTPDLVINFGSCGTTKNEFELGTPYRIGSVYQDIDTRPLGKYGQIPYTNTSKLSISDSPYHLFTTDMFYDNSRTDYPNVYLESICTHDFIDMEGYSVVYTCKEIGVPVELYKWVSDDGNGEMWVENAQLGFKKFVELVEEEYL